MVARTTLNVLLDVVEERNAQDEKWGEQNHPDGTGPDIAWLWYDGETTAAQAEQMKALCANAFSFGEGSWAHIIREEHAEVLAEEDPEKLRRELIQLAAVAVAWVEAIDRRSKAVTITA